MNGCMLPLARMIQMKVEVIDYIVNTAWIIPIYGCDKYPEILFSLLDKLIVSSKNLQEPKTQMPNYHCFENSVFDTSTAPFFISYT
mmetsp:Transcript_22696/g.54788  ORF Transcript_22696/g.54788 Transcript_22696/m.54788 type:complete len:86 (-) Transcript_22696:366-623(-)